jgi:hypothetical protein
MTDSDASDVEAAEDIETPGDASIMPPAMSDNWRLRVDLHEDGRAHQLTEQLEAAELKHDLKNAFHDRVILLRNGPELSCYAGTRQQAEAAERLISSLAAQHGWHLHSELTHWHPSAEAWEDPDKPLPRNDAERVAEHAALIEREREQTAQRGYPEWEVRVQCASHHDTLKLSDKLRRDGLPHVHRWRYLLIGAADRDRAKDLAGRIEREAPARTSTSVEVTSRAVPPAQPRNPFTAFGGLGVSR